MAKAAIRLPGDGYLTCRALNTLLCCCNARSSSVIARPLYRFPAVVPPNELGFVREGLLLWENVLGGLHVVRWFPTAVERFR